MVDEQSIDLTNTLAKVLLKIKKQPSDQKIQNTRLAGYKTAKKYNFEQTQKAVIQTWQQLCVVT